MSEINPYWTDGDDTYWVSADAYPAARDAAVALSGMLDGGDEVLVARKRETTDLMDCSFDGCEEGHEGDCPTTPRDVWRIESLEGWGTAWPDIEKALADGCVVITGDNLVIRDGEVHWADDCWCERCDVLPVPVAEAPSAPMFAEGAKSSSDPEHVIDGLSCWCRPYRDTEDPEVIIHRREGRA